MSVGREASSVADDEVWALARGPSATDPVRMDGVPFPVTHYDKRLS